jgi:anaerobic selenocysteine-containing dehydrogenase
MAVFEMENKRLEIQTVPLPDNARDREEKGRSMRGEKNHSSKLSVEQVSRIKAVLAEDRMYVSEIAREYGVTPSTIAAIAKGTTWRHVKAAGPAAAETPALPSSVASGDS